MYRMVLPSTRPGNRTVASNAADKVLCLPIFPSINNEEVGRIIGVIKRT